MLTCRIILETDAAAIASRVSRPRADTTDIVINEETVRHACKSYLALLIGPQLTRVQSRHSRIDYNSVSDSYRSYDLNLDLYMPSKGLRRCIDTGRQGYETDRK